MEKIKTEIGMKVKLIKGTDESLDRSKPGPCTHGLWCAGRIPVGTIGTVFQIPQEPHQIYMKHPPRYAIDFGAEFTPRTGWHYGVGEYLDASLELVKD
jgi:hypothetical protein